MPQMWYYILDEHWLLKQSIGRLGKHTVQNLCIFLIKLTSLNDQIIDKYLLFVLNLYQVTYGLDLYIVMTALCRR